MLTAHDLEVGTDHELIRVVSDAAAGLTAVIAIHSTALGPAMGGVRRLAYRSIDDAVDDASRLSAAMTLKNSAAGLPLGGGKSVILDGSAAPSDTMLDAFSNAIEQLGGRYVAAEDMGTTPAHMDRIAGRTRWVSGGSPAAGGSGDPSPATATTVFGAIEVAARRVGLGELSDTTVGVLGVGKVGRRLAELAARAGARLVLADADGERARSRAASFGAEALSPDALLERRLDILVPCARGGLVTEALAESLSVRVVCGAANNILAADDVAERLAAREILYVPDFLANAGGIIHVGGEFLGWDSRAIRASLAQTVSRVDEVLAEARDRGVTPLSVAYERAEQRLSVADPAQQAA